MALFPRLRQYLNDPARRQAERQTRPISPGLFIFVIGALIPAFLWTAALALYPPSTFPSPLHNSTIYLLTAHPDDESMFFGPALHRLKQYNADINVICFSTGDNEGIGHIRKMELKNAVSYFGTPDNHVNLLQVVDEPKSFPDSMEIEWDHALLAQRAKEIIAAGSDAGEKVVNILTFDEDGVSGHTNHRALSRAARLLAQESGPKTKPEEAYDAPSEEDDQPTDVEQQSYIVWTLRSVPIYRKFTFVLDAFVTYAEELLGLGPSTEKPIVIVSSFEEYSKTLSAMTKAHISQMKWFRYAWTIFSRYMVVNDISRIH